MKNLLENSLRNLTRMMQAVKENGALKFAVITECLRIAKESIRGDKGMV